MENLILTELIATVLATLGSVTAVLLFEVIKNNFIAPKIELKMIRKKVDETLIMYSRYYLHPINPNRSIVTNKDVFDEYILASSNVRAVASELLAFAEVNKRPKYYGIKRGDILKAGKSLMGLSNGFFYNDKTYDKDYNKIREDEIRKLLKLEIYN